MQLAILPSVQWHEVHGTALKWFVMRQDRLQTFTMHLGRVPHDRASFCECRVPRRGPAWSPNTAPSWRRWAARRPQAVPPLAVGGTYPVLPAVCEIYT